MDICLEGVDTVAAEKIKKGIELGTQWAPGVENVIDGVVTDAIDGMRRPSWNEMGFSNTLYSKEKGFGYTTIVIFSDVLGNGAFLGDTDLISEIAAEIVRATALPYCFTKNKKRFLQNAVQWPKKWETIFEDASEEGFNFIRQHISSDERGYEKQWLGDFGLASADPKYQSSEMIRMLFQRYFTAKEEVEHSLIARITEEGLYIGSVLDFDPKSKAYYDCLERLTNEYRKEVQTIDWKGYKKAVKIANMMHGYK